MSTEIDFKRNIKFKRHIKENIDSLIDIMKFENKIPINTFGNKFNSSVIVNVGLNYFFEYLHSLNDEKQKRMLIDGALKLYGFE